VRLPGAGQDLHLVRPDVLRASGEDFFRRIGQEGADRHATSR
jgi:hypothetical protein